MITANILHRVFQIRCGSGMGSCFAVDWEGKQYLVTARHVVESLGTPGGVSVLREKQWKSLTVQIVGIGLEDVDVAVLAPGSCLVPPGLGLLAGSNGLTLGQDVHFLGFPYGLQTDLPGLEFPLPLVKKAIVSSFSFVDRNLHRMLLDGHNNPGFSGGPVVFSPPGTTDLSIAGVISGFRFEWGPVFHQGQPTPLTMKYNTGIVIAYGIEHAINLIKANPVGLPLA